MGMTMTQKILAAHAGLPYVEAGQLIEADLDLVLANDITGPVAIHEADKLDKRLYLIRTRWCLYLTTLLQIKILNQQNIVNVYVSMQKNIILLIILK